MRKFLYLTSIMLLLFTECSKELLDESYEDYFKDLDKVNICTSVTDAVVWPEKGFIDIVIPDETIQMMSTCGLLESLLEKPNNKMLGPWGSEFSDSNYPGVYNFNQYRVGMDKVALELFKRDNCFSVFASRYLTIIDEKEEHNGLISFFEMLLASDMCMSILNEKEKFQLMAMALKKAKYKSETIHVKETCHIMVAIMQTCNYTSFTEDIGAKLIDSVSGYIIKTPNGGTEDLEMLSDKIVKYARSFLKNEYK